MCNRTLNLHFGITKLYCGNQIFKLYCPYDNNIMRNLDKTKIKQIN